MLQSFERGSVVTAAICFALPATSGYAFDLKEIARYATGVFDESAVEISAFDPAGKKLFVVNGNDQSIDVVELAGDSLDTAALNKVSTLSLADNESPTSVAVFGDLVAASIHGSKDEGRPGKVVFFSTDGNRLGDVAVGALPDMVTFSPDGKYALTANEGEPSGGLDPEGSISIIEIGDPAKAATFGVTTAGFAGFEAQDLKAKGVRIFSGKTAAEDLEPEYVAISSDSKTAWVTLQENNAIAIVDIHSAKVTDILPLGTKDHSLDGNGFDSDDKANAGDIKPKPVWGLYMPDGMARVEIGGKTYLITANEGDARDEDKRIGKASVDANALTEEQKKLIGERLKISTVDGDTDGDGDIDQIHTFGARSFTVWSTDGELVYDSGDDLEQRTLALLGGSKFNSNNDENGSADKRSDDKGPEPEEVRVAIIDGTPYLFVGLERVGGVMVYDLSDPAAPKFLHYEINRDFNPTLQPNVPTQLDKMRDLGPEGITYISAEHSPFDVPLLAVAFEVSGSLSLYQIKP